MGQPLSGRLCASRRCRSSRKPSVARRTVPGLAALRSARGSRTPRRPRRSPRAFPGACVARDRRPTLALSVHQERGLRHRATVCQERDGSGGRTAERDGGQSARLHDAEPPPQRGGHSGVMAKYQSDRKVERRKLDWQDRDDAATTVSTVIFGAGAKQRRGGVSQLYTPLGLHGGFER